MYFSDTISPLGFETKTKQVHAPCNMNFTRSYCGLPATCGLISYLKANYRQYQRSQTLPIVMQQTAITRFQRRAD